MKNTLMLILIAGVITTMIGFMFRVPKPKKVVPRISLKYLLVIPIVWLSATGITYFGTKSDSVTALWIVPMISILIALILMVVINDVYWKRGAALINVLSIALAGVVSLGVEQVITLDQNVQWLIFAVIALLLQTIFKRILPSEWLRERKY